MEQPDAPDASPPLSGRVKRRTVFYIPGYDPRGALHYHRLYREEAAKQSAVNGLRLEVGPRRRVDRARSRWSVSSAETETDYVFLQYDDLIRARWSKTNGALLWDITRYTCGFITRRILSGMLRHYYPIFFFAIMAPVLVLICLLAALALALAAGSYFGWPAGLAAFLAAAAAMLALRTHYDQAVPAFWIGRICAFCIDQGGGRTPEMEQRIDAFANHIAEQVATGEDDEVLVVGHSVGSQIGVSVVARALRKLPASARGFSFLTLGQTIPLIGFQPAAKGFRAELQALSLDPRLHWLDFSAPADGLCFPMIDPITVCGGQQPDPAHPRPRLLSPRYPRLFAPAVYRRIKRDFYRTHFQYLMAADLPGDYDFFLITAGPKELADRYPAIAQSQNQSVSTATEQ